MIIRWNWCDFAIVLLFFAEGRWLVHRDIPEAVKISLTDYKDPPEQAFTYIWKIDSLSNLRSQ